MKIKILIAITLVIFIGGLFLISNFKLFDKEERILGKYPYKDFVIEVCEVTTGMTTGDVIQLRKLEKGNTSFKIIKSIEGYDALINFKVINDSTYKIILNDTSYVNNEPDTFLIREEKVF